MGTALSSDNVCYRAIKAYYGDKRTVRTGVKLIRHIDEGLFLLHDMLGANKPTQEAFAIHPMFQLDQAFAMNLSFLMEIEPLTVALVMEYRNVANQSLSTTAIFSADDIKLSPLEYVNQMLTADKVQNRKDFERFHAKTHPRAKELAFTLVCGWNVSTCPKRTILSTWNCLISTSRMSLSQNKYRSPFAVLSGLIGVSIITVLLFPLHLVGMLISLLVWKAWAKNSFGRRTES